MADPVRWGKGKLDQFILMIDWELRFGLQARLNVERQWRAYLEQYRAPAKQPTKKFPFEGAANYVMPITATDTDQLYAKFMQTIHAPENLWSLEALNERWNDAQKPLSDFLTWLDYNMLKMWNVNKRVFLEMVKLGTGIYKVGWLFENRPTWGYDAMGKIQKQQRLLSRPIVDHVRLADFIIPSYAYDIQPDNQGGAPWVAERLRINADRLRSLSQAQEPFLPNIDREATNFVLNFLENNVTLHDAKIQDLDYIKMGRQQNIDFEKSTDIESNKALSGRFLRRFEVEIWEVHARFPTGGPAVAYDPRRPLGPGQTDSQDDIIVWYHLPTRRVLRAIYNPYLTSPTRPRPYEVVRYFPGDGFYGIGICEQKEVFQTIGSDIWNFSMDNVLLANCRGIVAKAGANIVPGEPNYPGKIWITDGDIRQEFGSFQLADVYPSLQNLAGMVQQLGERRTGISDIQLGNMQNLPGRTPATTMLSLLQEGTRRPDLTLKDMRYEGLSHVGLRLLQLCQQFISSPKDLGGKKFLEMAVSALGEAPGALAAQKLQMPMEAIEQGIGVFVTATSQSANKEVSRQTFLALLQEAGQIYPQVIQLMGLAQQNPAIAPVAMQAANGVQELFKRLLEEYDIRNPEKILPLSGEPAQAMAQGAPAPGAPGPGGAPLPAGPGTGTGASLAPFGPVPPVPQLLGAT